MNHSNSQLERSAGILLHISSLPGRYACGDFGPEAYRFVKKLKKAGQKYWQILPLNPLDSSKGYSPYSPLSAFAGNTLFISPLLLSEDKYLPKPVKPSTLLEKPKADYADAEKQKGKYLQDAYKHFKKKSSYKIRKRFEVFCEKESIWLEDFALFISIRNKLKTPWYDWPEDLRNRHLDALADAANSLSEEIEREKFYQFLFAEHWKKLKKYCHKQGVKIIGDIPIYTSHDSADVWANPEYFKLTETKAIRKNAGVPPDYFNEKGQLWNMPVYDWKVLEETKYSWWIDRLRKNLELYDIVRLDHFRGFSSYWEVDGTAEDAINGAWIKGPGSKLFDTIKKAFPEMPFIAEDLGDIDEAVFVLRDKYNLPGMRILQFAFEGDMPHSIFIPHNYNPNSIVYTGTHDNNTVRGWYKNEATKKGRKNLSKYTDKMVSARKCHQIMIKEAYKSVAKMAIVPMQDILGLGEKHRMNYPSTEEGNWVWRLQPYEFNKKYVQRLKKLSKLYYRS